MKKLVLSLSALFFLGFANAQDAATSEGFRQGDTFISGSVGFGSQKTGDVKTSDFNVSPKIGYFVTSNIALGVDLEFSTQKQDMYFEDFGFGGNIYEQKTTAFQAGIFGRYYFTPASKFSVFTQLGVAYATAKVEVAGFEQEVNGFNIEFAPAISYFISDHFALEATFGILSYNTVKPEDQTSPFGDVSTAPSTDTFNIGLDLSDINFGVVYKF
jgi:hypothetical protein